MDSRQRLIDDVARQCGPSVVVLNLDEVQTCGKSSPMVTSHPRVQVRRRGRTGETTKERGYSSAPDLDAHPLRGSHA